MEKTKDELIFDLLKYTSNIFKVTRNDIQGRNRSRVIADARFSFCLNVAEVHNREYLRKSKLYLTQSEVARLANRDHAMIPHYRKIIPGVLKTDKQFAEKHIKCQEYYKSLVDFWFGEI